MDAVIQAEVSTLNLRTRYSCVDVVVLGETITLTSAWVTATIVDELNFITHSLWANAPNNCKLHHTLPSTKVGVKPCAPAFVLS